MQIIMDTLQVDVRPAQILINGKPQEFLWAHASFGVLDEQTRKVQYYERWLPLEEVGNVEKQTVDHFKMRMALLEELASGKEPANLRM